jgi:hypothetical protein
MDTSDQSTPVKPTWPARISASWQAVKTKVTTWWTVVDKKAFKEAALIVLLVWAVAVSLWVSLQPDAEVQPVSDVATSTSLQDQLETLRLRVELLEALASASDATPSSVAIAPSVATRRSTRPAAGIPPEPSTLSPPPPDPITRQSIDQFRASLRTAQPTQE